MNSDNFRFPSLKNLPRRGMLWGDDAKKMKALHRSLFARNLEAIGARLSLDEDEDGPLTAKPNTTVPGNLDRQSGYLWDTLVIAPNTAFPTQTTMFSVPVQGNTKLQSGTNLTQSGQLPFPQMIDINSLRIFLLNNITPTDMLAIYTNVWFQLLVNNFSKFEGLAWHLPAGGGLWTYGAQVGTAPVGSSVLFSASNGTPEIKDAYTLGDIIHIGAGEPFNVIVTATSAFSTQANTTNPPGTGVTLVFAFEGDRYRPLGG